MRMRLLIAIQFIIVITCIVAKERSSQQFSEIYYFIAISLHFSIMFYLILNLKHLHNNINTNLMQELSNKQELSKSITKLMFSFEKLLFFFASQTSELHLKKLGGWALDIDTAQLLTRIVKITSPINVLEFGSGTSTVILGRALREFPNSLLYSVEDEIEFLSETQNFLELNKLSNVELVHAPLQKNWYAEGPLESFPIFDLIFIDGPKENRINSIDFIESHSKDTTIFVIDDYGSIETEGLVEVLTESGRRGLRILAGDKRVAIVGEPLQLENLISLL